MRYNTSLGDNGELESKLREVRLTLSQFDESCGYISKTEALADILEAVRPKANWVKSAKGNWCFIYKCSGCGGGNVGEEATYCPDCGALMKN